MQGTERKKHFEISIVIPIYNREETIERCVESFLVQVNDDIELILVDDGSDDTTKEILHKYEDNEWINVAYREHGGVGRARNYGLKIASGKYVSFIDADDFVGEGYIETLLDAAKSDCDIIVYDIWYKIDEKGHLNEETRGIPIRGECPAGIMYQYLLGQGLNNVWGKLFKRSIIEENGIEFDETMLISEDYVFVMNYLEKCKTAKVCEKIPYYYEYNPVGTWRAKPQHMEDIIKAYDRSCDFMKNNYIVWKDIVWNMELMHCRFLRQLCSITVGLYNNGTLTENSIKCLLGSKLYSAVTNEHYCKKKYEILKYLMMRYHWKSLNLIFKMKGIK